MKNKEQNPYKAACWREKARCCAISPLTQAGLINYRSNCRGTWVVCINNFMKSFWKRTTCPLRRVFVLAHALVFFLSQYCSDSASNLNSWNHPHKILFLFLFFEGLTMVIVWINPTWLAHNPCTTCTCGSDKSRKKSLNKTFWSENLCKLSTLGEWMLVRKLIKKKWKKLWLLLKWMKVVKSSSQLNYKVQYILKMKLRGSKSSPARARCMQSSLNCFHLSVRMMSSVFRRTFSFLGVATIIHIDGIPGP